MLKITQMVKSNPLFFASFFPGLIDSLVTILGQGSQYWSEAKVVNEASPAYYFLVMSPWLFILGSIAWFLIWYWLFKRLKEPLNLLLMFLLISGHSWGSGSWIVKMLKQSGVYRFDNQLSIVFAWSLVVIYFVFVAGIASYCLKVYVQKVVKHENRSYNKMARKKG